MPRVVEADVYKQPSLRGSPKPSTGGPTIAVRKEDTLKHYQANRHVGLPVWKVHDYQLLLIMFFMEEYVRHMYGSQ